MGGAVVVACTDVLGRGGGGGGGAGAGSGLVGSMHTFHVSNVGSTCSPPGVSRSPSLGAGLVGSPQFPFQWTANEGGMAASMPVQQQRSRCMRLVIFARGLLPCTAGRLKLLSLSRLTPMSLRSACSHSAQPDIASAAVSVIPSRQLRPTVVSGLRCARRSSLLPQTCSSAIVSKCVRSASSGGRRADALAVVPLPRSIRGAPIFFFFLNLRVFIKE